MNRGWHIIAAISCMSLVSCVHEAKKNKKTQSSDEMAAFLHFSEMDEHFPGDSAPTKVVSEQASSLAVSSHELLAQIREREAKLTDIPLPLGVTPLPELYADRSEQGIMLGYNTAQPISEVATFYEQEMEREGWRQSVKCQGGEQLICFEKPHRFCAVSIRPGLKKFWGSPSTVLVLYAGELS